MNENQDTFLNNWYNYVIFEDRVSANKSQKQFGFVFEPKYVGAGHGSRYLHHFFEAEKTDKNNYKLNWIRKYKRETGHWPPVKIIIKNLSKEEAFSYMEVMLIKIIGRVKLGNGPLLNLTDGGEGTRSYIWTEDQLRNKSIAVKKSYIDQPLLKEKHSRSMINFYAANPEEREKASIRRKKLHKEHPEIAKNISCRVKKRYEDPREREKTSNKAEKSYDVYPELRERRADFQRKRFEDLEERKKQSIRSIESWKRRRIIITKDLKSKEEDLKKFMDKIVPKRI